MAQRYLDPRNDIVFKRIFGEHPKILRSFLNAVLPLPEDGQILSLEYLTPEQVPQLPTLKNTIVDVRCQDQQGRQFIVEMQINWTSAFLQCVLFNASKAYVRQLEKKEAYELLQPVIGLAMLDAVFDHETSDFYHDYRMVKYGQPEKQIEGLQLVFIELPKFRPEKLHKPLRRAWLRFLKETGDVQTTAAAEELASAAPELKEALDLAAESAFSPGELEAYDRYWDVVRTEKTLLNGKTREAREEGRAEGRVEGRAEGMAEARAAIISKLMAAGMSAEEARRIVEA